jgi:hypothetical protein
MEERLRSLQVIAESRRWIVPKMEIEIQDLVLEVREGSRLQTTLNATLARAPCSRLLTLRRRALIRSSSFFSNHKSVRLHQTAKEDVKGFKK